MKLLRRSSLLSSSSRSLGTKGGHPVKLKKQEYSSLITAIYCKMAMFSNPDIDVETLRFSYKTIAGTIKLPVQVRPLQDEAHEIAKQFAIVNHIHGDDIVNQLSEEVSKFITSSLRRRLKRAQSEIHMMQT